MISKIALSLILLAAPLLLAPGAMALEQGFVTASGYAVTDVTRAMRSDGVLHIALQFNTDVSGYSGELIYRDIGDDEIDALIHLEADGEIFPLLRVDGAISAPARLQLGFNYDPENNPRVGRWEADFIAPPQDAQAVFLILPNVAPIGPIAIRDL